MCEVQVCRCAGVQVEGEEFDVGGKPWMGVQVAC